MTSTNPNPLSAFAPLRILVVDDEGLFNRIAADHYSRLGFEVITASDGAIALDIMEEELPDIVLCDRKMPEMSGFEFLEAIRKRGPEWQNVTFVFVTALSDRRDIYAMKPLNPDGYFFKPLDFEKADAMLAEILASKSTPSSAP